MIFAKRFTKKDKSHQDMERLVAALNNVQAVIWFDLDGYILDANENFLQTLGYSLEEIKGKHHRIFVDEGVSNTDEYTSFWNTVVSGQTLTGKYPRRSKSGKTVWIEASYNPIFDENGNPEKVVKFAIDVTKARERAADAYGQLSAISKSQSVIEYDLDGNVLTANDNILNAMGYTLDEVQGKNHAMFVSPRVAASSKYKEFWAKLANGEFQTGEYTQISRDGSEIWIQASYIPILGANKRPVKIVNFATEITKQKEAFADSQGQLEAISKALAVIEFDLDGQILAANDNFLSAMGYSLDEITGQHHSIFVSKQDVDAPEYAQFWAALAEGRFVSDEFRRVGKNGQDVWIQASYNPILGPNGRPYKVVKYATDITERKLALKSLAGGLDALLDGDLSARLPNTLEGEFKEISQAFNTTMVRLEELVQGILETAVAIADETKSIAENSVELASRNENQATTVQETSAAIDEISSTIKSTALNSENATNSALTASTNAQNGSGIVKDAIDAMKRIEESSSKIGQVVEVIDGISFQTNLLALNAGVEAARAGEAGSGFAIVASEVRALAQKAAESARQINDLIVTSSSAVSQGSVLVSNSGAALQQIADDIDDVVTNINDIQVASSEQAVGISEVTKSVSAIDGTTQNTAALAEESAAAAALLAERAENLRNSVGYFKVRGRERYDGGTSGNTLANPYVRANSDIIQGSLKKVVGGYDREMDCDDRDDDGWSEF